MLLQANILGVRRLVCKSQEFITQFALFFVAQALDKDSGAYGSVLYSIVHEEIPGIFSLDASTGGVILSNLSAQITGKLHYTLSVSAVDNLEKVPYHRANKNASVHVRLALLLLLLLFCVREQLPLKVSQ